MNKKYIEKNKIESSIILLLLRFFSFTFCLIGFHLSFLLEYTIENIKIKLNINLF
jgi:hypothetical protein